MRVNVHLCEFVQMCVRARVCMHLCVRAFYYVNVCVHDVRVCVITCSGV